MIKIIVLILTSFLVITMILGFIMATIKKEEFFGKPAISKPFFLLAKACAFTNILLLIPYGLNMQFSVLFHTGAYFQYVALALFIAGFVITAITSSTLKKDLKFGLPRTEEHTLQTKGIYSLSRHPFYMGFLMIMFSSVLLIPNIINIICFIVGWILHHFIMIAEERFLMVKYGNEYSEYMKRVRRYF